MSAFPGSLALSLPLAVLLVMAPLGGQLRSEPDCAGSECSPPQACQITVPYLEPMAPVIETADGDVRQGDSYRVVCGFRPATRTIEWPSCDARVQRNIERYRQQLGHASGNRYSGMLDVNGITVRVTASPPGGRTGFELEHLWFQKDAGQVSLVCKVDNMLQPYVEGSARYLDSTASLNAGPRLEGRVPVGAADLPPRGSAGRAGKSTAGSPALGPQLPAVQGPVDAVNRALNPQPDVPNPEPPDEFARDRTAASKQVTQPPPGGQARVTESPTRPDPPILSRIPSIDVGVDSGGQSSSSSGAAGSDEVPVISGTQPGPQSEIPVQLPSEKLATPPETSELHRDSDKVELVEPDTMPTPPQLGRVQAPGDLQPP